MLNVESKVVAAPAAGIHGRPRLQRDVLVRERLLACLDDQVPLAYVHGPAGSGKTVLLADWARRPSAGRGVWITVDDAHRFRTPFWIAVGETLAEAGFVGPDDVLASAREAMGATSDLRDLLVRGMRQLGEITLVIDNAGRLDDATVEDVVEVLCAVPTVRVVAAGRRAGVWVAAHTRMRLDVASVSPADLALTLAETGRLGGVSGVERERLFRASEGHPLVVRAHLLEAQTAGDVGAEDALEQHVLAIMAALEESLQRFVRRTVVADTLTLDLALALVGDPEGAEGRERDSRQTVLAHLEAIEDRGLGMWSEGGSVFRYTTALRMTLRGRLQRQSPQTYVALRRRVAEWALAGGRFFDALQIGAELDDLDMVDCAVRAGFVTLGMAHDQGVRELLGHLSLARLRDRPMTALILALVYNAEVATRPKALTLFALAIVSSRTRGRRLGLADRIGLRSIENGARRVTGRPSRRIAASIAQMLDEMPGDVRQELSEALPVIYSQLGITWLYTGETGQAVESFENALAAAIGTGRSVAALHPLALLAGTHALMGNMVDAEEYVQRAQEASWPDGWRTGYPGTFYQLGQSLRALERMDLDAAQMHLDLLAGEVATTEHWAPLAYAQGWADLAAGHAEAGLIRLEEVARHHGRRRGTTAIGDAIVEKMRVVLAVASGRAPWTADAADGVLGTARLAVLRGWVALLGGHGDKALEHLARGARDDSETPRGRTERSGVLVAALLRAGDEDAAAVALTRFAALLDAYRLRLPLLLLPGTDRAAMVALAERTGDDVAHRVLTDVAVADVFPSSAPVPTLTPREIVVLHELVQAPSSQEIAERLQVSTNTVRSQMRTLYRKLGAGSRQEALVAAERYGLL